MFITIWLATFVIVRVDEAKLRDETQIPQATPKRIELFCIILF
jgi:hypothetical protein